MNDSYKDPTMMRQSPRFQALLVCLLVGFFIFYLRNPPYDLHVTIHVVPTCIALALLAWSIRHFGLSDVSFVASSCFLILHIIGTRYIYSFVPYDQWAAHVLDEAIYEHVDSSRNHYDRFVHFAYGLFMAPVAAEVYRRLSRVGFGWGCFFAVEFVLASSLVFELLEWLGAIYLAPEFADSYLGQQGDIWDAHKDMALAGLGALASMSAAVVCRRLSQLALGQGQQTVTSQLR